MPSPCFAVTSCRFIKNRAADAGAPSRSLSFPYITQDSLMKYYLMIVASAILMLCACRGEKTETAEAETVPADSVPDSLATDSLSADTAEPPVAADGLFDDFMYNFMRNRKFQKKRIKFPLENLVDGKNKPIAEGAWKFDPVYVREEVYTMLFDDEKSVTSEKDTSVHHVIVEWVYLDKGRVKQYHFFKEKGQWRLFRLDTHNIGRNANRDFFEFYKRFSTDPDFQMAHIANPFEFKTYDSDNFQAIDGVLDVAQWPDFKPDMPSGRITNINYGQRYSNNGQRVLVITSPSAGMSCTLSFRKHRGVWALVRMESI